MMANATSYMTLKHINLKYLFVSLKANGIKHFVIQDLVTISNL